MSKGFTIIELLVVMTIIAILSGVVLFSVIRYISSGKDSNVAGNLSVLVPAGEIYYNNNNGSYSGFCNSEVVRNSYLQMPKNSAGSCYDESSNPAGVCCNVNISGDKWAACAVKFSNINSAFCVDSRGVRREIDKDSCNLVITECR